MHPNENSQLGAIIEIAGVQAKVVYLSVHFRNVMAIRHFAPGATLDVIYTSRRGIGTVWPVVASEPVTAAERENTRRIVGGDIYVEDRVERAAVAADYAILPQMDVCGSRVVERWAGKHRA